MGLDMYLTRRHYVENWEHNSKDKQFNVNVKTKTGVSLPYIQKKKVRHIEESAMYWRKSNAIHSWFVVNVQGGTDDCGTYRVSRTDLEDLIKLCEDEVKRNNGEVVTNNETLEPASGFFFGSIEKDDVYYDDLEETAKVLKEVIDLDKKYDVYPYYYYHASW